MNTIDIVLGIILVIAFFIGLSRGFLRVLASLIGLVVGAYFAIYFSGYVEGYLVRWFDLNPDIIRIASFLITFILILILFALLGRVLTKVANFAMLGFLNKLLGGVFNVIKYAFLLSLIFMFVNATDNYRISTEEKRESSKLYAPIAALAPAILPTIEQHMEELDLEPIKEIPVYKTKDSTYKWTTTFE